MPENNDIVKWEHLKHFADASKNYTKDKISQSEAGVKQQINTLTTKVDKKLDASTFAEYKTANDKALDGKANKSEVPLIQVLDAEPADRNCIWFKPYDMDSSALEALINTNNDPEGSEISSEIDGSDFGVDNATTSEDISDGEYNFTIL